MVGSIKFKWFIFSILFVSGIQAQSVRAAVIVEHTTGAKMTADDAWLEGEPKTVTFGEIRTKEVHLIEMKVDIQECSGPRQVDRFKLNIPIAGNESFKDTVALCLGRYNRKHPDGRQIIGAAVCVRSEVSEDLECKDIKLIDCMRDQSVVSADRFGR